MTTYTDLIDRWNSDDGKPYKGELIDMDAYNENLDGIGCMCAQGQVLHLLGGWTPAKLDNVGRYAADRETSNLLNISRAHAVLLRIVNDSADGAPAVVLTDPGAVLGDKWSSVLDFWWYLDGMTGAQWATTSAASPSAWTAAWDAAGAAAWNAAGAAAGGAAGAAAWNAAWAASPSAGDAAGAAAWATNEIQGVDILRATDGTPLVFLSAFGFAGPESIPPRPADYGVAGAL